MQMIADQKDILPGINAIKDFLCRPAGAQFYFLPTHPFRLRMRSPSGWANLATRLRRWSSRGNTLQWPFNFL